MKLFLIKILPIIMSVALISGCGSDKPFSRGIKSEITAGELTDKTGALNSVDFDRYVQPVLEQNCTKCHDNPAKDYATALTKVKPGRASESELYLRATGKKSHVQVLDPSSQQATNIEDWINGTPNGTAPAPSTAPPVVTQPTTPPTPPTPPSAGTCIAVAGTSRNVCESDFKTLVSNAIEQSCSRCHDNPAPDFKSAMALVTPGFANQSEIYLRATGQKSHKKVWAIDSQPAKNLETWIVGK